MITVIAEIFFPSKAEGSFIMKYGKIIGSELIGQNFQSEKYFWSRPSAVNYNPLPSGASNLSVTSAELKKIVDTRRDSLLHKLNKSEDVKIPNDLLFASGSGLDPHISVESALIQVDKICDARKFNGVMRNKILSLIKQYTEPRQLKIFGVPRINVLKLNFALDILS